MIAFIDTSALIKKYVIEKGTAEVVRYWNSTEIIVVSAVAYAEFFAAINRKKREGALSADDYKTVIREFKKDWATFEKVSVNKLLHNHIEKLTSAYPLRGFDAIHLASALNFQNLQGEQFVFLCADNRLNDSAQKEGLTIIDVS